MASDVVTRSSCAARAGRLGLAGLLAAWVAVGCAGDDTAAYAPERIAARERTVAFYHARRWDEARRELEPLTRSTDAPLEDLVNLAHLLMHQRVADFEGARPIVERAARMAPDDPRVLWARYRLAAEDLVTGASDDESAPIALLRELLEVAPRDFPAALHLANHLSELGEEERRVAQEIYRALIDRGLEQGVSWHMAALYRYGGLLRGEGRREESLRVNARFDELMARGYAVPDKESLDEGTYGRLFAPEVLSRAVPRPAPPGRMERGLALPDTAGARGLGWAIPSPARGGEREFKLFERPPLGLRIASCGPAGLREHARGADGWSSEPVLAGDVLAAAALDVENDLDLDWAAVVRDGNGGARLVLVAREGDTWDEPRTLLEGLREPVTIVPVDLDHEGDLDLLVGSGATTLVLRNDGAGDSAAQGSYADVTAEVALPAGRAHSVEDFDRDQDVDVLLIGPDGGLVLASDERNLRFSDASATLPAAARAPGAAAASWWAGDLDGDARPDLARVDGDGLALFHARPLGGYDSPVACGGPAAAGAAPLLACDADLDGSTDLLWPNGEEIAGVLAPGFPTDGERGRRSATWTSGAEAAPATGLLAADLDADGDLDLLRLDDAGVAEVLAPGGPAHGFLLDLEGGSVPLDGEENSGRDNARAVGAVVEVLAGSIYRRVYWRGQPEWFGLGDAAEPTVVRVIWPSGVLQSSVGATAGGAWLLRQRPGPPGSCPFLYAWNGTTYGFVSDVLGITPLGLPMEPGVLVPPDHDEYVLVRGDQLVPKDGVYELQLTEELREVTYLDRVRLDVVDHPAGTEVFPNERFTFPPFPAPHTHTVRDPLAPLAALDQDGRDWAAALAADDGELAVPFRLLAGQYQGLATRHTLELAFDPARVRAAPRLRLVLNGWFLWTDASVNVAAARDPAVAFVPPLLAVPDDEGGWSERGPIGFPAGKLKTMVVDVTDVLVRDDPRLRLSSTLRLYWDSIRLAVDADDAPLVTTPLEPRSAELWERGFSKPIPLFGEHFLEWFAWEELADVPRWDQHPGWYTRYGECAELVDAVDDRFVVMGAGDALTLRFDAAAAPPLPAGWTRDYLLFLDGWAKDRDPNTIEALEVEPLPFHGMSGYPYGPDERFPDDEAHRRWRAEWQTRPARRWIEPLAPAFDRP